jgi:hypothetical protein
MLTLSDVPFVWKSQLHSEITLSMMDAEYSTLRMSLQTLLLLHDLLIEVTQAIGVEPTLCASIHCHAFQDNHAAHQLAMEQCLTNRTKYFLAKFHLFWSDVCHNDDDDNDPKWFLDIATCSMHVMCADILMKGLLGEKFEANQKMNQGW